MRTLCLSLVVLGLIARFLLVAGGSVADAMLPVFVGWTVGMLSTTPPGQLFAAPTYLFIASLALMALGATAAAVSIGTTVLTTRAPGMTLTGISSIRDDPTRHQYGLRGRSPSFQLPNR